MLKYLKSLFAKAQKVSVKEITAELNPFDSALTVLFDEDFYLTTYPDIAAAGVDPLGHYLQCGHLEGRLPLSVHGVNAEARINQALELDPNNIIAINLKLELGLCSLDTAIIEATLSWLSTKFPDALYNDAYTTLIEDAAMGIVVQRYGSDLSDRDLNIQAMLEKLQRLLPQSDRLKTAAALLLYRTGRLKAADALLLKVQNPHNLSPQLSDMLSTASSALTEARIVNRHAPLERRLLLLDSAFPSKVSSFRYGEFRSYLEEFDNSVVLARPDDLVHYGELLPFHQQVEQFVIETGLAPNRIRYFDRDYIGSPRVAYCVFLSLADYFYSQIGLPSVEHLLFTLYPGGAFALNDPGSDLKLRRLCDNPKLKKIITTQIASYHYLINGGFCDSERIAHIYGGIIPELYKPNNFAGSKKNLEGPLDVCFVAQRYTAIGAEKGYDVFVEVVKRFANSSKIRFHVVGRFDANTIDIGTARNITFYGTRPADFFNDFYLSMDLILSPNIQGSALDPSFPGTFDGFPTTAVVEAGLREVAMFLTDFKGFNQRLDGTPIFSNEEMKIINRNPDDICSLIDKYLSDRAGLAELGAAGRRALLREFSYEAQMCPRIDLIAKYLADGN